jgi:hypothetical protein
MRKQHMMMQEMQKQELKRIKQAQEKGVNPWELEFDPN